jgi:hypothetical protein
MQSGKAGKAGKAGSCIPVFQSYSVLNNWFVLK